MRECTYSSSRSSLKQEAALMSEIAYLNALKQSYSICCKDPFCLCSNFFSMFVSLFANIVILFIIQFKLFVYPLLQVNFHYTLFYYQKQGNIKFIMNQNPQVSRAATLRLLEVDPSSIRGSPLNSSPSKMQYSIPKSKRFEYLKPSEGKFYDLPEQKGRSASLGVGKKMQFGKQLFQKPSPGQYYLKSDFESNKKKGITISAGREIIKTNSVFQIKLGVPGPGQYQPKTSLAEDLNKSKGYSLSSRSPDFTHKWIDSVPGPGTYETIELLDKNFKTNNSRIENVKSSRFDKTERKPQFEQRIKQNIPGPSQYQYQTEDKIAKYQNNSGYRFSHSQREGIVQKSKISIPGPGAYQRFSQFLH